MNPETAEIASYLKEFGRHLVAEAIEDATWADVREGVIYELAAAHAVHAAEILIKARIAEEHPLLIFSSLPRVKKPSEHLLDINDLLNEAKSYSYTELPDLLWATTGYRISKLEVYREFGRIRNQIQHLRPAPNLDLGEKTLKFVFEVLDPMLKDFWGITCIDKLDDEVKLYLVEKLNALGIPLPEGL